MVTLTVRPEMEPEDTVVTSGYFSVVPSPLVADIKGGTSGTASGEFTLDASGSKDPDVDPKESQVGLCELVKGQENESP